MRCIFLCFLIFSLSWGTVRAYHRPFAPRGDTEEILKLIYLDLRSRNSHQWALIPQGLDFQKFSLLPHRDFLFEVYRFDLSYPAKSILYQTFLDYNLRYFLADKTLEYLDYRDNLEKFKAFYQTAKKILGPYLENPVEGNQAHREEESSLASEKPLWSRADLERFLARRLVARISGPSSSSSFSFTGYNLSLNRSPHRGPRKTAGGWPKAHRASPSKRPEPLEIVTTADEEEDAVPGFLKPVLGLVFGLMDWFGRNKELVLCLYGFALLLIFLFSASRKR